MTGTNIHDSGPGRFTGGETPTNDDHLATKKYVDDHASSISVTDGVSTVTGLTELDFTSGATVTDAGGGVAQVAVAGGGSQTVNVASVTLDDDDITNLAVTPFQVVAAQGANTLTIPLMLVLLRPTTFVPYTDINPTGLGIHWGDGAILELGSMEGVLMGSEFAHMYPAKLSVFSSEEESRNTALLIDDRDNSDPYEGGNPANTLTVVTWYTVADTPT